MKSEIDYKLLNKVISIFTLKIRNIYRHFDVEIKFVEYYYADDIQNFKLKYRFPYIKGSKHPIGHLSISFVPPKNNPNEIVELQIPLATETKILSKELQRFVSVEYEKYTKSFRKIWNEVSQEVTKLK